MKKTIAKDGNVNDNKVEMDLSEFLKEHKRLISILKKGDRIELMNEAKKQEKEVKKYV